VKNSRQDRLIIDLPVFHLNSLNKGCLIFGSLYIFVISLIELVFLRPKGLMNLEMDKNMFLRQIYS